MIENFSQYGKYILKNNDLQIQLPNVEIIITKMSDSSIQYSRQNNSGKKLKKIINVQNLKDPEFELCPVFPIHTPAQKTRDFVFLRMKNNYQIGAKSSSIIDLQFPIEIGFFIKRNDNIKERIDVIACEPKHARFALYGDPQKGTLCKFANVDLANDQNTTKYVYSEISVSIHNELPKEISIGKFVFPISYNKMYYDESHVYVDGIEAVIHEVQGKHLVKILKTEFNKDTNNLNISPSGNHTNKDQILYIMDRGFD